VTRLTYREGHVMILKYRVTIDDLVAFNRHVCDALPSVKWAKWRAMFLWPALILVWAFLMPTVNGFTRPMMCGFAGFWFVLYLTFFRFSHSRRLDRQIRQLYEGQNNEGVIGEHELEINPNELIERTDVNESRRAWRGIDRFVETDGYVFIFESSATAHVIPKAAISEGDIDAFVIQAEQFWIAAQRSEASGKAGV
jgi:hypothetical protein